MTANPDVRYICGRTDIVTSVDGRALLFQCDRELWHYDRHHAANIEGVELFWEGSRRSLDPDPLYVPEPGTDDEPWTVPEPDPPADRRDWALAVLVVALVVVAIAWRR